MDAAAASFWRRNGLSLVLACMFITALCGQFVVGHRVSEAEHAREGRPPESLVEYASSGHFISATFENWESEFLQMGMYVLLTVWLRQRGSAESRPLDPAQEEERIDAGPTPRPVLAGGAWKALYANSLSLAFLALFLASFVLHLYGSWQDELAVRAAAGQPPIEVWQHLAGAEFWFESLQNWQSEFLAVLAIVVLSIFLRQDKSPESKPLRAPHRQTGT
ncbi:hypothetical protein E5843_01895 [Luteimonas yindakuii]|uniref:DUF6766 family protein n=1 Tax=Luteimonas yindakuii TaxID=2565782 RepID=UPI0010A57CBF|nr:DUF6766 family protein [Luteimonas yindakuii]QCO66853.1 hypothetical protein E5843_01895 [Luteimonas yindakuii]